MNIYCICQQIPGPARLAGWQHDVCSRLVLSCSGFLTFHHHIPVVISSSPRLLIPRRWLMRRRLHVRRLSCRSAPLSGCQFSDKESVHSWFIRLLCSYCVSILVDLNNFNCNKLSWQKMCISLQITTRRLRSLFAFRAFLCVFSAAFQVYMFTSLPCLTQPSSLSLWAEVIWYRRRY